MAVYSIPFGTDIVEVEVKDDNFLFYALPLKLEDIQEGNEIISKSLDNPVGTEKLELIVMPWMKVAVIIDDITRPTPTKIILAHILKRLEIAGVQKKNIKIVIALGTHRQMTRQEMDIKVGSEIYNSYEIVNIDYKDKSAFVSLGVTDKGTPVNIYKVISDSDFKISIGNIVPHIAAGWGGGAKAIQPGVCGEETTAITHLMACTIRPVLEVCGNPDNECRNEMEEIAAKVGLNFIVNTVMDEEKNILGVFSGHLIKAHRKGIEFAQKVMCPEIQDQADILIASANPCYIDYWQGCKPYIFSQYGVKEGGCLIFLLDAKEGMCGNAPQHEVTLRKYSLLSFEELKELVEMGDIKDIVGINVPIYHSTIRKRVTTICVSNGLNVSDMECLGFIHAKSVQDALDIAFAKMGSQAKVGIIPFAGETLVKIKDKHI